MAFIRSGILGGVAGLATTASPAEDADSIFAAYLLLSLSPCAALQTTNDHVNKRQ